MGKSAFFETGVLQQIFQGTHPIANWTASGGSTSMWIGLHTADPTVLGSTVSEGGYAAYARVLVDRSSAASIGWSVTSGTTLANASASPLATIAFPQNTAVTTGTFSFMSIWPSAAGSSLGAMIYSGTVTPNINFSQNVTPQLTTATAITES